MNYKNVANKFYIILFTFFMTVVVSAQNLEWIVYNTYNSGISSNNVMEVAVSSSRIIWVATLDSGICKFDGTNWTVFKKSNSPLPSNNIFSIAIDKSNNVWIGTNDMGLIKYNGVEWSIYNTTNSGLTSNSVWAIEVDRLGNLWIGSGSALVKFNGTNWTTYQPPIHEQFGWVRSVAIDSSGIIWVGATGGLAKFNGSQWIFYKKSNSGIPDNDVWAIAVDHNQNIWVGTGAGGIAKFDRITNWVIYNTANSILGSNWVVSLCIDKQRKIWIGTESGNGLVQNNAGNWQLYNFSNSDLPSRRVRSLVNDQSGNLWIGTLMDFPPFWFGGGLAVFKEGGVVSVSGTYAASSDIPKKIKLYSAYPNPFNPTTQIKFSVDKTAKTTLEVFDLLGQKVLTLYDDIAEAGRYYTVEVNAVDLTTGVYFYKLQSEQETDVKKLLLLK